MKTNLRVTAITLLTGIGSLFSQTTPTPWNLNTAGNYSFTSLSSTASSLPASMAIHQMNTSPVALTSTPVSDIPLPLASTGPNNTNVWGLGSGGIGIRSNPVAGSTGYSFGKLGEVVVALNTTSRTGVQVSFKAGTCVVASASAANFRLRCQYRVGTSGGWSEIQPSPVEYQPVAALDSVNMGPYALPAETDNKAVVQVRWVFYYVSGNWTLTSNKTHRVQLDNISITSKPIVTQSAFAMSCPNTSAVALSGGSPSGGTYSGAGVSANTFHPSAVGSGTYSITYSYTDAFGNSNSTSQNMTVDYNACTTQMTSSWCGATNVNMGSTIYCDPVTGVEDYQWMFTNTTGGSPVTLNKGNNYESFALWIVPGLKYGQSYNVQVRAKIGGQWRNWGPVCSLSMQPNVPSTQLAAAYCGITNVMLSDELQCEPVTAATAFQYEFTNSNGFYSLYTQNNDATSLPLWAVNGLQYAATYNVRVRANVAGMWSAYGNSCTITMLNSGPVTELDAASCGATNLKLSDELHSVPVVSAGTYQYEFTNGNGFYSLYTQSNGANSLPLSSVTGLQYGQSYSVRVRTYAGGTWSAYGNPCTITMNNSIPATQLNSVYCGATDLTPTSDVYCDPVEGAEDFHWWIENTSIGYGYGAFKGNDFYSFSLSVVPGLQTAQTYTVWVRAKVAGTWGPWGNPCSITLGGTSSRLAGHAATETKAERVLPATIFYPNPIGAGQTPKLFISGAEGQLATVRIMDHMGRVLMVRTAQVTSNGYETEFNEFPQLSAGIYFIRVSMGTIERVERFVVE